MLLYFCLFLGVSILVAAFLFCIFKLRPHKAKSDVPNTCMGAIRVTHEGRNMLIIRKDDGSFEMLEEEPLRKQCIADAHVSE